MSMQYGLQATYFGNTQKNLELILILLELLITDIITCYL